MRGEWGWTTAHELDFVAFLGGAHRERDEQLELLTGYRQAIARRQNWGAMDATEVCQAVEQAIASRSPARTRAAKTSSARH